MKRLHVDNRLQDNLPTVDSAWSRMVGRLDFLTIKLHTVRPTTLSEYDSEVEAARLSFDIQMRNRRPPVIR
ncbi:MAG: hypothetical protein K2G75_05205, partial [Muribaculaceae bacterium]|nr:hypothetical protein [Muribaculaceae bacterium]